MKKLTKHLVYVKQGLFLIGLKATTASSIGGFGACHLNI
jgi:hypothetical protein